MRRSSLPRYIATVLVLIAALTVRADPPKPGATGNPDNVPYIGNIDPKGNPVRLAKATGHALHGRTKIIERTRSAFL
jgi:hypothetical protein